jgi:hypothetical protein
MNNPLPLRTLMMLVIMIATGAGILALVGMKFPDSAVVIALAVGAIAGTVYFVQRKEKAARFDVYFRTVGELGQPLSYGSEAAAFERDGTRFEVEFPSGKYHMYFRVTFHLPNLRQKFSVQNKSLATTHHDDCYWIQEQDSPLPPEFLLQSRNPDFLLRLLENRRVRDEILNYNASMWSHVSVSFADGDFELRWTPPLSEQIDGFDRACRTAVVFHDELRKISVKYLN